MDENKIRSMLLRIGLGKKAGKIVFGTDAVCDAIREGKMLLVLIASDASENSKKRITNCASYYKVKTETPDGLTTATLGTSIGRSPTACIGITDENFVKLICAEYQTN
ncbi:MAG: ribosomal L7Ae/L30e/S12e/Gadd45 family protein [Clostridia bacterium]|nr:ribosomal L7Ae/L30e/S12e/Gadd45 family protein [Clostridia bacterium]MBO4428588.1 ribosomal L7Ae/L30e/S12e/Gadd45 family protein [Clostridia bacterium]